ncbi:MbcA/ParS/Xre antitoxin family protein [Hydrocarboniclastica marina]|uniref:DUF2384 domain-containing protein n=1 Tax=Hydrocarboniclastica marina TaxID=2259620 RepID=A0A4P7XHP6_9ALTE|nr:MbcA/ParS/Xre antitoxin family protein [Hydrocarboniclastica marina]QCF25984.1 DUF2384 domain-containing protein [Hydrocarboniclastica marina]
MKALPALDIQDSRKLSATGLKVVLNILEKWGCTAEQVQAILRISRPAFYKYRKKPEDASLNQDQLERLSYLLNIHGSLRIIFENPDNVYGFMSMPNDNPFFNGKSPLSLISTGSFAALYETFKRIDALRGGLW